MLPRKDADRTQEIGLCTHAGNSDESGKHVLMSPGLPDVRFIHMVDSRASEASTCQRKAPHFTTLPSTGR